MKVAIFHPWIYLKGGIERTIVELVKRSRHDWTIHAGLYMPDQTFAELKDYGVIASNQVSVSRQVLPVAKACLNLVSRSTDWSAYDAAVISCDGIGNLLTVRSKGAPLICLCHTPLRVAYDPVTAKLWKETRRPDLKTRLGVRAFAAADRLTWRRYEKVFCVSEEVRRRVIENGLVKPDRTEVLHTGVDTARFRPTGRSERFFLLPGRIMWTKNIELAIKAFIRMKADLTEGGLEDFRLVIAGMVDEKSRPYLADLRRMAEDRRDIEFVISPSDDELMDLYDRSFAVLFTALNEDWGLVPLEAMAFAKPVVAVDQGGPAESVVDGVTGFLRAPTAEAFAGAMRDLLVAPRRVDEMGASARERAEQYDWQHFVARMDGYIEELVAQGPRRTGRRRRR